MNINTFGQQLGRMQALKDKHWSNNGTLDVCVSNNGSTIVIQLRPHSSTSSFSSPIAKVTMTQLSNSVWMSSELWVSEPMRGKGISKLVWAFQKDMLTLCRGTTFIATVAQDNGVQQVRLKGLGWHHVVSYEQEDCDIGQVWVYGYLTDPAGQVMSSAEVQV